MYFRTTHIISLFCISVLFLGCAALFSVQEWSENYALMEGAQSTTPQAIDGNLNTIGEAIFPASVAAMSPASEVIITLPEKKSIRRIVVHTSNVMEFDIYATKDSLATDRNWDLIKEVKKVQISPIQVSVLVPYPTNRIRIRVIKTRDDAVKSREFSARNPGYISAGNRRSAGKFQEIELYGYKTNEEVEVEQVTDERETELDELLNLE